MVTHQTAMRTASRCPFAAAHPTREEPATLLEALEGAEFEFRGPGWIKEWKELSAEKALRRAAQERPFQARRGQGDWEQIEGVAELKSLVDPPEADGSTAELGLLEFARGMFRHRDDPLGFLQEYHGKLGPSFEVSTPTHGDFVFDSRKEVLLEALTGTDGGDRDWEKSALQGHGASFLIGDTNIFSGKGQDWAVSRAALAPHLKAAVVRSPESVEKIQGIFEAHLDRLEERTQANGGTLEIRPREEMQTAVLDAALQLFFSVELPHSELLELKEAFNTQMSWLPEETLNPTGISLARLPGNKKLRKAYQKLEQTADHLIEERLTSGARPGDILDSLLQAKDQQGKPLSRERVRHEVLALLEAGHETTATLMGWMLLMMAHHPAEYRAVQAEVGSESVDYERLKDLDGADRVLKETLRMYPPFYLFMREAAQDVTVAGLEIEKGTTLVSSLYENHRDESVWGVEDTGFPANEFHSDRFKERAPEKFTPFGAGRRGCLGRALGQLEAGLMLTRVAQRFELEPVDTGALVTDSDLSIHPRDARVRLSLKEAQA